MNVDEKCAIVIQNPNMLVPWYLVASYSYYIKDDPVISDTLYDEICKKLLDKWDEIEHYHKHLVDRGLLEAGTGFHLSEEDYPSRVKGAYELIINPNRSLVPVQKASPKSTRNEPEFGSLADFW